MSNASAVIVYDLPLHDDVIDHCYDENPEQFKANLEAYAQETLAELIADEGVQAKVNFLEPIHLAGLDSFLEYNSFIPEPEPHDD